METPRITIERIREYLRQGKRFDGRKLDEFRDLKIELGVSNKAEGSAKVKLGDTEVLVGVKLDLAEPYPDSPDKGNLMVTAELLPMSSSRFESGPPSIESIELARILDRMVRESKFIELEKLCIKEGEKVWNIFIDIYSMNANGNLLDAAGIGVIAALKTARIPKYDKKEEKVVYGEWTDDKIPVKKDTPLSITFHKIGDHIVVDPTQEEEDASETRVTIGSCNGVISSMQKGDHFALSVEEMENIIDLSEKAWKTLHAKLEKTLKEK